MGKEVRRISTPAINMMFAYHWPGNVRELENCIEYAVLFSSDGVIHGHNLPPTLQLPEPSEAVERSLKTRMRSGGGHADRRAEVFGRNITAAARQLGITPRMVRYKLKNLGIDDPRPSLRSREKF